jgi:cbb3-type cytochrome oxidase subunit 3
MSLTDIVSALNQSWLAEAGLVCFLAAFAVIVAHLFRKGHRAEDHAAASIPLNDAPLFNTPPTHAQGTHHASAA